MIDVLLVQLCLTSGAFLSILVNFYSEGKQRRFIKHSFRHYLSPSVVDELISNPDRLKLGGQRKDLSIFFSDLQGFTAISEELDPEALAQLLNEYLTIMTDIILEEGGTIDKYEGDAIIAFWNAPLSMEDHAYRSVYAAIRCQEELDRLRAHFREKCGHDLYMRIGINTGPAVVGNFGSNKRFDYTMLGDAVNLAARLEGINKVFGTFTLVSEDTWEKVSSNIAGRFLGRIKVIGKNKSIKVYEPMSQALFFETENNLKLFEKGRTAFEAAQFQEAIKHFEKLPDDPAAQKHLAVCLEMLQTGSCKQLQNGIWQQVNK